MPESSENQLTREQVLEQFGNTLLRFAHYYKYTFTFAGTGKGGYTISVGIGGQSDDIYRLEVTPTRPRSLKEIARDGYSFIIIRDASNKVVFQEYTD